MIWRDPHRHAVTRRAGHRSIWRGCGALLVPTTLLIFALAFNPSDAQPDQDGTSDVGSTNGSADSKQVDSRETSSRFESVFEIMDDPPGYPAVSIPSQDHTLAFTVRGIVGEIPVKETQTVEPGDALVRLKDDLQTWVVETHRLEAEDETNLINARKQLEVAQFDLEMLEDARKEDGVTPRELVHARAESYLAENAVRAEQIEQLKAKAAYERERARLDEMTIRSGIHGIVTKIAVDPGEAVDELQAVIQLVSIDPLWIDVAVPVPLGLRLKRGDQAVVHWRDVRRGQPFDGAVLHVLPVAESASNSMIVRVELSNPEQLPSGLHAFVEFPDAEEALRREADRTSRAMEN